MSTFAERVESDISSVFLSPNDHGSLARFTHAGSPAVRIHVIFTDRYEESDLMGMRAGNSGPAAIAASADVDGVAVNDILEVQRDGEWVEYRIIDIGEDEEGMRTLKLSTHPLHG
jgi:hypothetical protein